MKSGLIMTIVVSLTSTRTFATDMLMVESLQLSRWVNLGQDLKTQAMVPTVLRIAAGQVWRIPATFVVGTTPVTGSFHEDLSADAECAQCTAGEGQVSHYTERSYAVSSSLVPFPRLCSVATKAPKERLEVVHEASIAMNALVPVLPFAPDAC